MTTHPRSFASRVRRLLKPALYLTAFILVPALVGSATLFLKYRALSADPPPTWTDALPATPVYDPGRRTAVVLAGNRGTEATDLLAPYQILAASDSFNVYVVAPERRPSALFPGSPVLPGVDLLPHFSFADYEAAVGTPPDLLVIPFIPSTHMPAEASIIAWVREHVGARTVVLSICGGAMTLADTGLLEGRPATSHQNVLRIERERHPEVDWRSGVRFVETGNLITSAGITAGIDATLFTLRRMLGAPTAEAVARKLGYPHMHFLDDPAYDVPAADPYVELLSGGFRWGRTDIGLVLEDGIDEMALAAVMDTYPRSYAAQVHTVAREHRAVRTKYGLDLVPGWSFEDVPALDRAIVLHANPSGSIPPAGIRVGGVVAEPLEAVDGRFVYDLTIADMARRDGPRLARAAATGLEYPAEDLGLGSRWPVGLLVRIPLLGLIGVGLVYVAGEGLVRRKRRRQAAQRGDAIPV